MFADDLDQPKTGEYADMQAGEMTARPTDFTDAEHMRVEIIIDKAPLAGQRVRIYTTFDRLQIVLFVACLAGSASNQFSTPSSLDRQASQQYRTQFLRQAARIWQAPDESEARQRYTAFCQQWQPEQPKAIQTLRRDFEATLAFYAVQEQAGERNEDWPAHLLRTTSPLERTFRDFRGRYRLAVLFHSEAGARSTTSQLAARFS